MLGAEAVDSPRVRFVSVLKGNMQRLPMLIQAVFRIAQRASGSSKRYNAGEKKRMRIDR